MTKILDTRVAHFKTEAYGAVVATIAITNDQIVEVQRRNDGVYGLIIHRRKGDGDQWEDLTAYLKPEHFAKLGSIAPQMLAADSDLRQCGYCASWHSKPCGEGCCWSHNDPTASEIAAEKATKR